MQVYQLDYYLKKEKRTTASCYNLLNYIIIFDIIIFNTNI